MTKTILITTTHNLNIDMSDLKHISKEISRIFSNIYLTISETSSSSIIQFFRNNKAFHCEVIPPRGSADARRRALLMCLQFERGGSNYFYCDFDKIVVATLYKRRALKNFVSRLNLDNCYLVVGRNRKSFRTFPQTWRDTEKISNLAASSVFDIANLDITSGCCAFSSNVGKLIVDKSNSRFTDTEWPLICTNNGIEVQYNKVSFIFYISRLSHGRNDENWRGYIPRLTLALRALKSLEEETERREEDKSGNDRSTT